MKSILFLFMIVCFNAFVFSQNTIQHIVKNANLLNQQNVEIYGTVKKTIPLAGLCSYILEDQGSEILINSSKGCPSTKGKLIVQGKLGKTSGEAGYHIEEISRKPFTGNTVSDNASVNKKEAYTAPIEVNTEVEEMQPEIIEEVPDETEFESNEVAEKETSTEEEPVFIFVEESATFQGGDVSKFREWVQNNLVYPQAAAENGIYGKVFVQFAINSRGETTDVKVLRGVDSELDKETIRVILSSPRWAAAKQGGRVVKQQFVIPVLFTLQ
jgi:TonB family protein